MNKKGQVLVIFVILLPLLLLFSAYVVDTTIINYNKNRLDNINKIVDDYIKDKDGVNKSDIEDLLKKNDKDIVIKNMDLDNNIDITLEKEIDSIFGKFIGKDKYIIKSNIKKNKNG